MDLEVKCEELKTYFSTLDILGQKVLKKKVRKLTHSSTSSLCPSPVKYKSKMRVNSSRKGQESGVHRDPSYWECGEGSQRSQTTKRSCTKLTRSQPSSMSAISQSSTASSRDVYLSQLPNFLHSYIDDIIDVGDDENCDCLAIATLLGLDEES